jgi:uncharacterized Zn-finger protein
MAQNNSNVKKITCSGDDAASKHPLIYLNIGDKSEITCPYCGKIFKIKNK